MENAKSAASVAGFWHFFLIFVYFLLFHRNHVVFSIYVEVDNPLV